MEWVYSIIYDAIRAEYRTQQFSDADRLRYVLCHKRRCLNLTYFDIVSGVKNERTYPNYWVYALFKTLERWFTTITLTYNNLKSYIRKFEKVYEKVEFKCFFNYHFSLIKIHSLNLIRFYYYLLFKLGYKTRWNFLNSLSLD